MKKEKYSISGMSCAACQARVEKAVSNLDGVSTCAVNLLTNSMQVEYDEKLTDNDIISAVKNAGYGASHFVEKEVNNKKLDNETKVLLRRLLMSFLILIPLFYIAMGYMVGWYIFELEKHLVILGIIEAVLALTLMIINHKFFTSGFKALFHSGPNMDTLVALGSGISFVYSFVLLILLFVNYNNQELMMHYSMNFAFETAGMVPTFITIGKTLEAYSKGKTTTAIKALINLMPKEAHLVNGEVIKDIKIDEIKLNDLLLVKPGESFPVDGIIVKGESSVNEAMITGESLPIDKVINDEVKAGTININSVLYVKATKIGKETTLSKIIKLVEDASLTKSKISQIVDKVSLVFVPVVIGISIIVFTFWMIFGQDFVNTHLSVHNTLLSYSLDRGISVLVISCPCALGLATPVAIMVGNGKAAKNGILFKNSPAIENLGKAKFVVLDKTGTITKGSPEVNGFSTISDENEFIQIAYSLELLSEHPLAKAIVQKASDYDSKQLEVKEFESITGIGLKGKINGVSYQIVNESFINENKIINPFEEEIKLYKNKANTLVFILKEGTIYGFFAIKDEIKEDSKEAIKELKSLGLIPIMLTGDNEESAREIAKEVGIEHYVFKVLPEDKLVIVKRLQEFGQVIMVGDGINDAPALTQADIGVSIKRGSDIAIDSADVILMKSTLIDVAAAIRVSRATTLNIKENLFWAFFYNIIMIPIAAGALSFANIYQLKPYMGSLAMSLSSLCVVLNALRLNIFKLYSITKFRKTTDFDMSLVDLTIDHDEENYMKKEMHIKGMMCEHCVARVDKALRSVEGVNDVKVNLKKANAIIKSKEELDNEILTKAVVDAGYEVTSIE